MNELSEYNITAPKHAVPKVFEKFQKIQLCF